MANQPQKIVYKLVLTGGKFFRIFAHYCICNMSNAADF